MRDPRLYLKDILEAMKSIDEFIKEIDFVSFQHNDLVTSAVIRKLEIIGEAVKNIPKTLKQNNPTVPRKIMGGMRDRLIHVYFGIKYDLVWNTIKDDIPKVKPVIEKIYNDLMSNKVQKPRDRD